WGLREEQDSSYGDRVISSTPFYAGVAFIVWLSLPHVLTDQCQCGFTAPILSIYKRNFLHLNITARWSI
ncbi:MAG: hypothetical protein ACK48D_15320, partial [Pseudanabaena sp.]